MSTYDGENVETCVDCDRRVNTLSPYAILTADGRTRVGCSSSCRANFLRSNFFVVKGGDHEPTLLLPCPPREP